MWIIHRKTIVITPPEMTTYHNTAGIEDETALNRSSRETFIASN